MDEIIKKQILSIQRSGLINMLDTNSVQRIAFDYDYYDLVLYLEEHRKEYVHFILTGSEK
jgi:hypothetical protein